MTRAHLVAQASSTTGLVQADQRVWPRYACGLNATCRLHAPAHDTNESWPAWIFDLSIGGLRMALDRDFEPGTELLVEISGAGSPRECRLRVSVVHVAWLQGGKRLAGCAFANVLTQGELERLVNLSDSHRAPDGQSTDLGDLAESLESRSLTVVPEVSWHGIHEGRTSRLRVEELHLQGRWPLPAGSIVRVWFPARPEAEVRLHVKRCYQDKGHWFVDYTLLDAPPLKVQLLLGFRGNWTSVGIDHCSIDYGLAVPDLRRPA